MRFSAGGIAGLAETRFDSRRSRPGLRSGRLSRLQPRPITVPKDAPLTFLVCADDDRSHLVATVELDSAFQKQGVSSKMHIYASGRYALLD
jgi:endo-1,4-beta-xylanase